MSTSLMPLYISEIATEKTRNVLGIMCPVGITFGLFIGQLLSLERVLGNADLWNILLAVSCVPVLISMVIWPFLPESPHFLFVIRQQSEAAIKGNWNQLDNLKLRAELTFDVTFIWLRRTERAFWCASGADGTKSGRWSGQYVSNVPAAA